MLICNVGVVAASMSGTGVAVGSASGPVTITTAPMSAANSTLRHDPFADLEEALAFLSAEEGSASDANRSKAIDRTTIAEMLNLKIR